MYHPTTRLLTVLELLQSRGRLSGEELARRLEVDRRSVRRYIVMLQDLGIPIEGQRGRHGGYRLRPGFKLPPLLFTENEALAITLGLITARQAGLATTAPAIEGALAKLDRVLPDAVRERVRAVQETVFLDLAPTDGMADSETVVVFSDAASRGQRLRIHYRTPAAETERTIDPYGLVYREGRWYVVGWCHLRSDRRVFRLDRVVRVELLDECFERPTDFDSTQYVLDTLASMPGAWEVEVLLETSIDEARRWIPVILGSLEEAPGGVMLRCRVESLDQMAHYLNGLPCEWEVRRPLELLTTLEQQAERVRRLAARSRHFRD